MNINFEGSQTTAKSVDGVVMIFAEIVKGEAWGIFSLTPEEMKAGNAAWQAEMLFEDLEEAVASWIYAKEKFDNGWDTTQGVYFDDDENPITEEEFIALAESRAKAAETGEMKAQNVGKVLKKPDRKF